jgi:hypothetical protein
MRKDAGDNELYIGFEELSKKMAAYRDSGQRSGEAPKFSKERIDSFLKDESELP